MTLPRYTALRRHWDRWPPMAMLLAAWLGAGPQAKRHDLGGLVELLGGPGLIK